MLDKLKHLRGGLDVKRLILMSLVVVVVFFAYAQEAPVHAARWITTERVWDDERLQPNETFTWSGGHDDDGFAAGQGVLQWYVDGKPGNRYEGNMAKGKINGKGICTFANGNSYEGDWVDGRRTGKGIFTWANGNRYEGDFVKDQRTGKGIMIYVNGDRYEGDWVDGRHTGKGVMAYANGNRYEGDWVEDKKVGRGIMILADGRRQEGKWIEGYAGPEQNPLIFPLIFGSVAGAAIWVISQATQEGRLSGSALIKYTGFYVFLAFIAAVLMNSEVVGQFIFHWDFYGFGLHNTAVVFVVTGMAAAVAFKFIDKELFFWRRLASYAALYGLFTLILFAIWYVYTFFFVFFIFSLGWR